jgi:hypothetical protein
MKFLLGLIAGVILASVSSLSAQDGTWWTPGGKSGSYSHNPALGSTWVQESDGTARYLYSNPIPQIGQRNPC